MSDKKRDRWPLIDRRCYGRPAGAPAGPRWGALAGALGASLSRATASESIETWGPGDAWTAARLELRGSVWTIHIASLLPESLLTPGAEVASMPAGERVALGVLAPRGEPVPGEAVAAVDAALRAHGYGLLLPEASPGWSEAWALLEGA